MRLIASTLLTLTLLSCSYETDDSDLLAIKNLAVDPLTLVKSAEFSKLRFASTVFLMSIPERAPGAVGWIYKPVIVPAKLYVTHIEQTSSAIRKMGIHGKKISETEIVSDAPLHQILQLTEVNSVKSVVVATREETNRSGALSVGSESDSRQVLSDNLDHPLIQRARYEKLSKDMLDKVRGTLARSLNVGFGPGLVKFTQANLTQGEVSKILPTANLIAGAIGTFHNIPLHVILKATTDPLISHFENARPVGPVGSMGVGN